MTGRTAASNPPLSYTLHCCAGRRYCGSAIARQSQGITQHSPHCDCAELNVDWAHVLPSSASSGSATEGLYGLRYERAKHGRNSLGLTPCRMPAEVGHRWLRKFSSGETMNAAGSVASLISAVATCRLSTA